MLCSRKSSPYDNRKVQDSTWGAVRLSSQAGVDVSLPVSSSIDAAVSSQPEPFLEWRMGAVSITSNLALALPPDLATTHQNVSTMQISPLDVVADFATSYPNINAMRRYRCKHRCALSCCFVRSNDVLSKPCVWCQAPGTHFQCSECAAARVCQVCHSVREAGRKVELSRNGHDGRSFCTIDDSEQEEYDFTDEWASRDYDYAMKHFPSSIPATVRARFESFA